MQRFLRRLFNNFIPPIIVKFFIFIIELLKRKLGLIVIPEPIQEDITGLREKYNLKLPNESVIMGNGPSLNHFLENNIDFIEGKSVFVVNNFLLTDYFEKIKPIFCVFVDPDYWHEPPTLAMQQERESMSNCLASKVDWDIFIFMRNEARSWNWFTELPAENSCVHLVYFNDTITDDSLIERYEKYKNNEAIIPCVNVLIPAIFLSLNLGFKTQYLVGADMSLHETVFVNDQNIVCNKENHFYEECFENNAKPFFIGHGIKRTIKFDNFLDILSTMFKRFNELEAYSKFLGTKIYNASNKSYIDAFERYFLDNRSKFD